MQFASWPDGCPTPIVATAVHAGHTLRPEIAAVSALNDEVRRREEDPFTEFLARECGCAVVVDRSRFEVDLNRGRSEAVYLEPGDAWSLDLWSAELTEDTVERSRVLHDRFYTRLGGLLEDMVVGHGGFVLYDIHSYNHRPGGPTTPVAPAAENPVVNLGTGSLPDRWEPVASAFATAMGSSWFKGSPIDARQNVKFKGRYLAEFVNQRFASVGCALAIEFKKTYMDEWTGTVDRPALNELAAALVGTVEPVLEAYRRCL